MTALSCGFNWSTQHLSSNYIEEDVENETTTKKILHRRTERMRRLRIILQKKEKRLI